MVGIDKDSMVFQFMIKEYEKLYSKFDMHYQAVEKTINFYIIFIGAVISFQGLTFNKSDKLSIFSLNGVQLLFLLIIVMFGLIIYLKVIEHRLLIIAYVKSLNLNRKWFLDHSEDTDLSKYFFFKANVRSPDYYKKYRHFYWEAFGLAAINSLLFGLLITNIIIRLFHFTSTHALAFNCLTVLSVAGLSTYLSIKIYKWRGNKETLKIEDRIISGDVSV